MSRRAVGRTKWNLPLGLFGLLTIVASTDLGAQVCAGLPSGRFSIMAALSLQSEERGIELSPGARIGPGVLRIAIASLSRRGGIGRDARFGSRLTMGRGESEGAFISVCPTLGAEKVSRDGARSTDVFLGAIAARRVRIAGAGSLVVSPTLSGTLHKESVRFDSVTESGEDYTRYSYSDLFGVVSFGLAIPVRKQLVLRTAFELPISATVHEQRLRFDLTLGFGRMGPRK